jgi:alkylglycerol monooxygenase
MGFLEHIIVTPSHHRVHHAINPIYLDKNYSQIFIIWDKLFGTFQEERDDVRPVYGVTRPVRTWNPIKINFMHLWLLIKDAWHAHRYWDKLRIWFMPLGWRPPDVAEKFPVYKISDVCHFEKYNPQVPSSLLAWCWVQLFVLLLLISYLFGNIAAIGAPGMFVYGAFVFLSVYAFTELLDKNRWAWVWELLKNALGIYVLIQHGDWFGLSQYVPGVPVYLFIFFALSSLITVWLNYRVSKEALVNG